MTSLIIDFYNLPFNAEYSNIITRYLNEKKYIYVFNVDEKGKDGNHSTFLQWVTYIIHEIESVKCILHALYVHSARYMT